jgi:hypothetical protein
LLDGVIGAAFGGFVAAVTAVFAIRMTSRRQRKDDLEREAKRSLLTLLLSAETLLESLRREPFDPGLSPANVHLRIWPDLVQARVALELVDRPDASDELRRLCSGVVGAAQARIKGEPPAGLFERIHPLREYVKPLLRELSA